MSNSSKLEGLYSSSLHKNSALMADSDWNNNNVFKDNTNSRLPSDCKNGRVELFFNITNVFQTKQQDKENPSTKLHADYPDVYESVQYNKSTEFSTVNRSNTVTVDPCIFQDKLSTYTDECNNENHTIKRDKKFSSPIYLIFV